MVAVTQADEVMGALSRYLDARDALRNEKRPSLGFVRTDEHHHAGQALKQALEGFAERP